MCGTYMPEELQQCVVSKESTEPSTTVPETEQLVSEEVNGEDRHSDVNDKDQQIGDNIIRPALEFK